MNRMSNNPPKINPTGTTYKNVLVVDTIKGCRVQTKAWLAMMKVVGEYIKADYDVKYTEYEDSYRDVKANVVCSPPLFPIDFP
jgi:hypothetical protein